MTSFQPIIKAIYQSNNIQYNVVALNENILEIQFLKEEKSPKYIIFEPKEIYTSVEKFIQFLETINKRQILKSPSEENILRIPFFSGVSVYDLSFFLWGEETHVNISTDLDIKINFELFPVNFNLPGAKRFCKYLNYIKNIEPRFRSNNNFSSYLQYFLKEIKNNQWRYNTIIPLDYLTLCPENKAITAIFKELEEMRNKDNSSSIKGN
jgi:hypothetical protein